MHSLLTTYVLSIGTYILYIYVGTISGFCFSCKLIEYTIGRDAEYKFGDLGEFSVFDFHKILAESELNII